MRESFPYSKYVWFCALIWCCGRNTAPSHPRPWDLSASTTALPFTMAPKRRTASTSQKRQSPLKQATLSFKATKRGAAASSKAKAKTKPNSISRAKSETGSEGENDNENITVEDSESEGEEAPSVEKQTLDVHDQSGKYNKYFKEVKKMMGGMPPCESIFSSCFAAFTLIL